MSISSQIRYFFEKHKGIKQFFKPFYDRFYKQKALTRLNKKFRANALQVLETFDNCMKEAGVNYTLAFGTLLGAVREKGFIKHDLDIDVMMWSDEYSETMKNILKNAGFKLIRLSLIEDGNRGREESYTLDGLNVDIFYIYPPVVELPYVSQFVSYPPYPTYELSMKKLGKVLPLRVELPLARERKYVSFETIQLPIPVNYDEILKYYYGDNYMIPDPNWSMGQFDRHIVEWREVHATYQTF